MGENDGVEPAQQKPWGVDQMQNAFETPLFFVLLLLSFKASVAFKNAFACFVDQPLCRAL